MRFLLLMPLPFQIVAGTVVVVFSEVIPVHDFHELRDDPSCVRERLPFRLGSRHTRAGRRRGAHKDIPEPTAELRLVIVAHQIVELDHRVRIAVAGKGTRIQARTFRIAGIGASAAEGPSFLRRILHSEIDIDHLRFTTARCRITAVDLYGRHGDGIGRRRRRRPEPLRGRASAAAAAAHRARVHGLRDDGLHLAEQLA